MKPTLTQREIEEILDAGPIGQRRRAEKGLTAQKRRNAAKIRGAMTQPAEIPKFQQPSAELIASVAAGIIGQQNLEELTRADLDKACHMAAKVAWRLIIAAESQAKKSQELVESIQERESPGDDYPLFTMGRWKTLEEMSDVERQNPLSAVQSRIANAVRAIEEPISLEKGLGILFGNTRAKVEDRPALYKLWMTKYVEDKIEESERKEEMARALLPLKEGWTTRDSFYGSAWRFLLVRKSDVSLKRSNARKKKE